MSESVTFNGKNADDVRALGLEVEETDNARIVMVGFPKPDDVEFPIRYQLEAGHAVWIDGAQLHIVDPKVSQEAQS